MKRTPAIYPDKYCEYCNGAYNRYKHPMTQRVIESVDKYTARRFCSKVCSQAALRAVMNETAKRANDLRLKPIFDEDAYYERTDHRYSSAFKGYQKMVVLMLKKCERALTTRDIHILLGVEANPRWTMDALEMSDNVLIFKGYPVDKFLWFDGQKTIEKIQWNGYHGLTAKKSVSADLGLEERVLA